jgi:DNA polymerase-4
MSTPRKIIHLDLDAFFCAVEEQLNPSLRGKAFAVGGRPEERGVVASCSYAARRYGVRSAMPMARALRLCPQLIIVSSHHGKYSQVSRQVMAHLHAITPQVEQISIDEAFLDVSDLPQPAETIARQLQTKVQADPGLPCSLGVATNKLLAKTANDVGKASFRGEGPPNAITVVPPGQEAAFLAPLPVDALWGIGPKTAEHLAEIGIRSIGELAGRSEIELMRLFGKNGYDLALRARGTDDRPIVTSHAVKSISQETTFAQDARDTKVLEHTLFQLAAGVGTRLRRNHLTGTTVKIKVRWADFTTLTRQVTLEHTTDQDKEIYHAALSLFYKIWQPGQPVRLLGVGVSGLRAHILQLSLWDDGVEKERQLQTAIDQLRQRFGRQIVLRGGDIYDENAKE